jgi:hypothetical protein
MIPQSLLPDAQSRKQMLEAIRTMAEYSFISTVSGEQSYSIHRLVHLATRNWLKEEGVFADLAGKVLARLIELFRGIDVMNRDLWRIYLLHSWHILKFRVFDPDDDGNKLTLPARCG